MLWVCRAGQKAKYYDRFLEEQKIYLSWDGYQVDLSNYDTMARFRELVAVEKQTDNRTSISNWAGQLYSFVYDMKNGDLVLVPASNSHSFLLAEITGDYHFDENNVDGLFHSRAIKPLVQDVPKEVFTQQLFYSLGAYRTVFKAKQEASVIQAIKKWSERQDRNK